ncbi:tRNA (guanine(26)-N(2))-dimethyltransferase-like [Daphnia pulex]|uniref:tRNA (guanine(26)-N(2))-dimethyltransferase-like n=1 Tax=Daphnia pulex TaxID=6669 RepID=UPI001EE11E50|nr:tRNA (guanine(26)-N(2))-dimethyltransferase-like [Daphnia pulex]
MADCVDESGSENNQPSSTDANLEVMSNSQEDHSKVKKEPTIQGTLITEGKAQVCFPGSEDNVFYNPVQEFNRDLSIAVLRQYSLDQMKKTDKSFVGETFLKPGEVYENGLTVLEALSASGLRSIRYAKEVGGLKNIIANDLSSSAVESITSNSQMNDVSHLITPNEGDASILMYQHGYKKQFHCVDIDPYGSPSPFVDAAVQCVADGGLLMVTATDMAILCGNVPETCYAKYASVSIKTKACHEMALRIILQFLQTSAARYGRYIQPLLSVSVDFYVRIFVIVHTGKNQCKASASKLSMVYQCVGCHNISWQPLMKTEDRKCPKGAGGSPPKTLGKIFSRASGPPTDAKCEFCHSRLNFGGPLYSQPIHDLDFVQSLLTSLDNPELGELKTEKRIRGILSVISEELPNYPLYLSLDATASLLKLSVPSLVMFRSAILNAGYCVSLSHCYPLSIKTDAPMSVIWDLFQGFAKKQYPDKTWPRPLSDKPTPADYILSRPVTIQADFTTHPKGNPSSRMQKLVRFQENPEKNWGPKCRAKANVRQNKTDRQSEKKKPRLDD